jgi:hypothetical protein
LPIGNKASLRKTFSLSTNTGKITALFNAGRSPKSEAFRAVPSHAAWILDRRQALTARAAAIAKDRAAALLGIAVQEPVLPFPANL